MTERRPLVAIGLKATDRIRDRAPPQGAASRRSNTIQEGGGAEAEQGEGRRARSMWKWRDWGLRQSGRDKSPPVQSRRSPRQSRRPPDWSRRPPRRSRGPPERNRRPPERDSRPPRRSRQSRSPPVRSRQGRRPPRWSRRPPERDRRPPEPDSRPPRRSRQSIVQKLTE